MMADKVPGVAVHDKVAIGAFAAFRNDGQSPAETGPLPSFEVAVIRPNRKDSPCCTWGGMQPGGYRIRNISLKSLIAEAYELPNNQISGGPGWVQSEHYDIEAKMSDSQYREMQTMSKRQQEHQTDLMLQSLLATRFGLKVDHQSKEINGYALVLANGSSKLHISGTPEPPPSTHPDSNGGTFSFFYNAKDSPLSRLVSFLSNVLDLPVSDETGLKGNYDVNLAVPEDSQAPRDSQTDADAAMITALQEQLGLKLKSQKVLADIIVITSIEQPSEN